jgi:hypothetical protein
VGVSLSSQSSSERAAVRLSCPLLLLDTEGGVAGRGAGERFCFEDSSPVEVCMPLRGERVEGEGEAEEFFLPRTVTPADRTMGGFVLEMLFASKNPGGG